MNDITELVDLIYDKLTKINTSIEVQGILSLLTQLNSQISLLNEDELENYELIEKIFSVCSKSLKQFAMPLITLLALRIYTNIIQINDGYITNIANDSEIVSLISQPLLIINDIEIAEQSLLLLAIICSYCKKQLLSLNLHLIISQRIYFFL